MTATGEIINVGFRLSETARRDPGGVAVVMPHGRDAAGKFRYQTRTFQELDDDSSLLASGLRSMGVRPGTRLALLVPPSIDFISLVFAMFKAGVVTILIDPGMGRGNLVKCLSESEPEGFVGIPLAQAVRAILRWRFPRAKYNVTIGRRWFWGGKTIAQLRSAEWKRDFEPTATKSSDPAAIIFTTGSTGPPKGVLYRHGNFNQQVDEIQGFYQIQPGEIDLPGFPLFALFNCAMGVTTVLPDMDPTRPARVDPRNIIDHVNDWKVTQAFGSPAIWNVVGRHCEERQIVLPTLKRVLSAGAPVPPHVLQRMKNAIPPDGDVHTPYGATESLPVASIAASEVLAQTAARSAEGAGTCVGRRFPGMEWRVIRISDGPIATLEQAEVLPPGEIGELIVQGGVVTTEYVIRMDANALHKIKDGDKFWHRMGDVGYLESTAEGDDRSQRFWFCGRKSHRVMTEGGTLFTIPCEAVFNQHERIYRSALVGVGSPGHQRPVIIAEPWPEKRPQAAQDQKRLISELAALAAKYSHTSSIKDFFLMDTLPTDIRHNAKIFREKLAVWAAKKLAT